MKQHSRPTISRNDSHDGPTLGLPNDPGEAWDEMVEEISAEIEARMRKGQPISDELKRTAAKLGEKVPQSGLKEKMRSADEAAM